MSKNTKSENNITSFLDRKYQNELCNSPYIKSIVGLMYPYIYDINFCRRGEILLIFMLKVKN